MTLLSPDFMDSACLSCIARGDVGAPKASVAALDAMLRRSTRAWVSGSRIAGGNVGTAIDIRANPKIADPRT